MRVRGGEAGSSRRWLRLLLVGAALLGPGRPLLRLSRATSGCLVASWWLPASGMSVARRSPSMGSPGFRRRRRHHRRGLTTCRAAPPCRRRNLASAFRTHVINSKDTDAASLAPVRQLGDGRCARGGGRAAAARRRRGAPGRRLTAPTPRPVSCPRPLTQLRVPARLQRLPSGHHQAQQQRDDGHAVPVAGAWVGCWLCCVMPCCVPGRSVARRRCQPQPQPQPLDSPRPLQTLSCSWSTWCAPTAAASSARTWSRCVR